MDITTIVHSIASTMQIIIDFIVLVIRIVITYVICIYRFFLPKGQKNICGQIVLITGGGHGIGRELAIEMSNKGAVVVTLDINEAGNNETANMLKEEGRKVHAYRCDITKPSDVKSVAEKIRAEVGEVTILINNAGILNGGPLLELSIEDIRRTFDVNTLSHFWTVKEFLPSMIKRDHGHIVTICSMAAKFSTAMLTDYAASKCAVFGFNEALTEEIDNRGAYGVSTSIVLPSFVNTGMTKFPRMRFGRVLSAREVALVAVDGILRQEQIIIVPKICCLPVFLKAILPVDAYKFVWKFARFGIGQQYSGNARISR